MSPFTLETRGRFSQAPRPGRSKLGGPSPTSPEPARSASPRKAAKPKGSLPVTALEAIRRLEGAGRPQQARSLRQVWGKWQSWQIERDPARRIARFRAFEVAAASYRAKYLMAQPAAVVARPGEGEGQLAPRAAAVRPVKPSREGRKPHARYNPDPDEAALESFFDPSGAGLAEALG